jgi:hypothetical protein
MIRLIPALLLVGVALPLYGIDAPPVVQRQGALAIAIPLELLQRPEARRHLTNGLTTSFVVIGSATRGGTALRGAARVEIRYEPWDQLYFVTHRDYDGTVERSQSSSLEALDALLQRRPLRFAAATNAPPRWTIELRLIPFTAAEQAETRAWIAGAGGEAAAQTGDADRTAGGSLFDLLIGTSIRARPVLAYRWTVAVGGVR